MAAMIDATRALQVTSECFLITCRGAGAHRAAVEISIQGFLSDPGFKDQTVQKRLAFLADGLSSKLLSLCLRDDVNIVTVSCRLSGTFLSPITPRDR